MSKRRPGIFPSKPVVQPAEDQARYRTIHKSVKSADDHPPKTRSVGIAGIDRPGKIKKRGPVFGPHEVAKSNQENTPTPQDSKGERESLQRQPHDYPLSEKW